MLKCSGRPLPKTTNGLIPLLDTYMGGSAQKSLFESLSTKRHGNCLYMRHDSLSKIVPTAAAITHAYMHACGLACTTSTEGHGKCPGCSGNHLRQFSQDSSNPRTHAYMHTCACASTTCHGNCFSVCFFSGRRHCHPHSWVSLCQDQPPDAHRLRFPHSE